MIAPSQKNTMDIINLFYLCAGMVIGYWIRLMLEKEAASIANMKESPCE